MACSMGTQPIIKTQGNTGVDMGRVCRGVLALLALSEVERQKKTPELHRFVVEVSSVA
jgi:hypothetical protein